MESNTIALSYAEGVYALADKHQLHDEFVSGFGLLDALLGEPLVRTFLESPNIAADLKKDVLSRAIADQVHPLFLNFVLLVVDKRRQRLFGAIGNQYRALLDQAAGRLHVQVTVARTPTPEAVEALTRRLSEIFSNTVIPHVTVDERILGGIVVKQGDQVIDGSLRRRLMALRRNLLVTHT